MIEYTKMDWFDLLTDEHLKTLPNHLQKPYEEAIIYFSSFFGKGFLKYSKREHPFVSQLKNKAPFQLELLIKYSKTLKALEQNKNSYRIIKDLLKSANKAAIEGMPFLSIAGKLLEENYRIECIPRSEKTSKKTPDLLVYNNNYEDKIYLEITHLDLSQNNKKIKSNHDLFSDFLYSFSGISFIISLNNIIEIDEINEYKEVIETLYKLAIRHESIQIFSNNLITIIIAPSEKENIIFEMSEQLQLTPNCINSLPLEDTLISRIRNKIPKKIEQTREYENCIIVIDVNFELLYQNLDLATLETRFEEYFKKHSKLQGIIITTHFLNDTTPEFLPQKNSFKSLTIEHEIYCTLTYGLFNPFLKRNKISERTMKALT